MIQGNHWLPGSPTGGLSGASREQRSRLAARSGLAAARLWRNVQSKSELCGSLPSLDGFLPASTQKGWCLVLSYDGFLYLWCCAGSTTTARRHASQATLLSCLSIELDRTPHHQV